MEVKSPINHIKQRFFAMRNGIVADSLKKAGSPYSVIFGLTLPQIIDISRDADKNYSLALSLVEDERCRESQLMSSLVVDHTDFCDTSMIIDWLRKLKSQEAIDLFCLKVLRHIDKPFEKAKVCLEQNDFLLKYASLRLLWNIYMSCPSEVYGLLSGIEFKEPQLNYLAKSLCEEIDYLNGNCD